MRDSSFHLEVLIYLRVAQLISRWTGPLGEAVVGRNGQPPQNIVRPIFIILRFVGVTGYFSASKCTQQ